VTYPSTKWSNPETLNFPFRRLQENRATAVVVTLVLILAPILVWNLFSARADARLDAIRRKGYPVTLSELNAWYQTVPDPENNARVYEKVFALPGFSETASFGKTGGPARDWPARGRVLSVVDKRELAELVATNEVALHLLHSAQASNRCRYAMDLNKLLSKPQLRIPFNVLQGVKLLSSEALLHSANGDSQQAVGSLLAAGLLADSISEEPLVTSQILRLACWQIVVIRLEHVLMLTPMTDEQLASLQVMVAEAQRPQALLRGLAGERALGIAAFTDADTVTAQSQSLSSLSDGLKARFVMSLSKIPVFFKKDRAFYLDVMSTNVTAAELPFPDRIKLGRQSPSGTATPRFCNITRMVLPNISEIFTQEAEVTAILRAAQTALAVELFRRGHQGTLPAALEELAPSYCKSVPTDPYDGKQLRFKTLNSAYVIYSIGNDGRDDGGVVSDAKNIRAGDDITFRVER
jgi:hypothetical protein